MGPKAPMQRPTVGAEKDAEGNAGPAVVVDAGMAVEAVLGKKGEDNGLKNWYAWQN